MGVELSGGLDSTAVTALTVRQLEREGRPPPFALTLLPPPKAPLPEAHQREYDAAFRVAESLSLQVRYHDYAVDDLVRRLRADAFFPGRAGAGVLPLAKELGVRVLNRRLRRRSGRRLPQRQRRLPRTAAERPLAPSLPHCQGTRAFTAAPIRPALPRASASTASRLDASSSRQAAATSAAALARQSGLRAEGSSVAAKGPPDAGRSASATANVAQRAKGVRPRRQRRRLRRAQAGDALSDAGSDDCWSSRCVCRPSTTGAMAKTAG